MSEREVDWPGLVTGEALLDDEDELLWRQVNPQFVQDGVPTSQAFRLSTDDRGRLSTARASKQTAAGAYDFHTRVGGLASAGTWAVSLAEVTEAGSRAVDDTASESPPPSPVPPGHTYIDLRPYTGGVPRRIASVLSARAKTRGRQHP